MHNSFVDFLNHGTLPFIGRSDEQQRIVQFWERTASHADSLRVLLVSAEAGAGKSRLIEETLPAIAEQGGVVIHLKLRPEGAASLGPLLAGAFGNSASASQLLQRGKPEPTLQSALAMLRRLCGLRRTFLAIEDIHLLAGPTLREFALLLEGLADEPLSALLATRPTELGGRAVAEHHISEEITLKGFSETDLLAMWQELFTVPPAHDAVALLLQATRGNALAIRSAMRGALRSGAIQLQWHKQGEERVRVNVGMLAGVARRSTEGIVDGMIADLNNHQLLAAQRLSLLGEVFSQEAAAGMLDDAEQAVRALVFRGILLHSTTPVTPLNSRSEEDLPLAFTHTLLHNTLVESAELEPDELARLSAVVANSLPIYTHLPIRLLGHHAGSVANLPIRETVAAAITEIARKLNQTADWQSGKGVIDAAVAIIEANPALQAEFSFAERLLQCQILATQLDVNLRSDDSIEHRDLAERLQALTEGSTETAMLRYHIHALEHLFRFAVANAPSQCGELFTKARMTAEQFPAMQVLPEYRRFLHNVGNEASNRNDLQRLRTLESIVGKIITRDDASEECRQQIMRIMGGYFLVLIESTEELHERLALLQQVQDLFPPLNLEMQQSDVMFFFLRSNFWLYCGDAKNILQSAPMLIQLAKLHGLTGSYATSLRYAMYAHGVLGATQMELLELCQKAIHDIAEMERFSPNNSPVSHPVLIGRTLHNLAILRGDLPLMRIAVEKYCGGETSLAIANRLLALLWEERFTEFAAIAETLPNPQRQLAFVCSEHPINADEIIAQFCTILNLRDYAIYNTYRTYITISLINYGVEHGRLAITEPLRNSIRAALLYHLEIFAKYQLLPCAAALLQRYGKHLSDAENNEWEKYLQPYNHSQNATTTQNPTVIQISLLDAITVGTEGKEPTRLRGGRNQTVLGLLVANQMLRRPLDRHTFASAASGIGNDHQRARVTANVAIMRLREALGREAITTNDDLPKLNVGKVRVDLLQAWDGICNADDALRRGRLGIAREQAVAALKIAAGKIPFPTLYDEIFERLREEFEHRLRTTTIRTAHALLAADDAHGAEELLALAANAMQGDDEVKEMLKEIER